MIGKDPNGLIDHIMEILKSHDVNAIQVCN